MIKRLLVYARTAVYKLYIQVYVSMSVGLPWALVGIGAALVPMSQIWRGPIMLQPWADYRTSTNELIGEDSPVIIRLDANQ